jgi:hypothetical protein
MIGNVTANAGPEIIAWCAESPEDLFGAFNVGRQASAYVPGVSLASNS